MKYRIVLPVVCLLLSSGCYYDKEELLYPGGTECSGVLDSFAADVNPIIQSTCATAQECHGAGSVNSGGPFTTYSEIKNKTTQIKTQLENGNMPKGTSMPSSEKRQILCWIESGAPNN